MSSDVDEFMKNLDKTLAEVFAAIEQNKPITIKRKSSNMGFDITTNISIKVGLLESLDTPKPNQVMEEPLIDIIDSKKDIKLIAIIPGIKREDVQVTIQNGMIQIQIKKENQTFQKKIPCNANLTNITTKSFNYNNSVLEMIFSKETGNGNTV